MIYHQSCVLQSSVIHTVLGMFRSGCKGKKLKKKTPKTAPKETQEPEKAPVETKEPDDEKAPMETEEPDDEKAREEPQKAAAAVESLVEDMGIGV